jgi:hypothetical protein
MEKNRYPYLNNPFGFVLPQPKEKTHPTIYKFEELEDDDKKNLNNIKSQLYLKLEKEVSLFLFGSKVKGNWDKDSDYDIYVECVPSLELHSEIKKMNFGVKVDIFFSDKIKEIPGQIIQIK